MARVVVRTTLNELSIDLEETLLHTGTRVNVWARLLGTQRCRHEK